MTAPVSLEILIDQIALLLKETAFTGGMLLGGLQGPLEMLVAGRAPRALGLQEKIVEWRRLLQALREIETESRVPVAQLLKNLPQWQNVLTLDGKKLSELLAAAQQEFALWKLVGSRAEILLKRLQLISGEEKLSVLGRHPLEEAWKEVRGLVNL